MPLPVAFTRRADFRARGALVADTLCLARLPAGLYLGIHLIEGETVTPMQRFTLILSWLLYLSFSGSGCGEFPARYCRCQRWQ